MKLSDFGVVGILQDSDKDTDKTASVRGGTRYRPVMVSHVGSVAYMGKWRQKKRKKERKKEDDDETLLTDLFDLNFAAPEFFLGVRYDQGVDMWACGVLMYMMYGRISRPSVSLCCGQKMFVFVSSG